MELSVIVPVYNAGKYLEQCLYSIQNQKYRDFEVILVDDGSTDISSEICDRFAQQDPRFRVFHKRNKGLIHTRITGLTMAKGEWIAFVDADDWVEGDFLSSFMEQTNIQEVDTIVSGCIREKGRTEEKLWNKIVPGMYCRNELVHTVFPVMLHYKGFFEFGILPYMWNKLFKKQLLLKCYKNINMNIYDGEDVAIVYPYLLESKKIVITNKTQYHYRIHSESMSAKKKQNYYENVASLYLHLNQKFAESDFYDIMLPQLNQYMRMMVWQSSQENFIESQKHWFPFAKVPRGAKIILYGAGNVGKAYYYQIKQTSYCDVVAWIDKNKAGTDIQQISIKGIEEIERISYDLIVIAVAERKLKEEILEKLRQKNFDLNRVIM